MNTRSLGLAAVGLLLGAIALSSCGGETTEALPSSDGYQDLTEVDGDGSTSIEAESLDGLLDEIPTSELSDAEADGLLFMREEEKLARDAYAALYEEWGLNIFQNIASSEQTHTDAVKALLERYGLEDPAAETDSGFFVDDTLQSLYDQLIATGSSSLADALKVGAAIEEIDILDLEERIGQTDKQDIQTVYENLMKGSRNHLRSFVSTLESQTGETYAPQYLSQEAYDQIVSASMERGGR